MSKWDFISAEKVYKYALDTARNCYSPTTAFYAWQRWQRADFLAKTTLTQGQRSWLRGLAKKTKTEVQDALKKQGVEKLDEFVVLNMPDSHSVKFQYYNDYIFMDIGDDQKVTVFVRPKDLPAKGIKDIARAIAYKTVYWQNVANRSKR